MNKPSLKMWKHKEKEGNATTSEMLEKYPYSQHLKWLNYSKNPSPSFLSAAAHTVYDWVCFTKYTSLPIAEQQEEDPSIFSLDIIEWIRKKKKKRKRTSNKKRKLKKAKFLAKGESVTDINDQMNPSVDEVPSVKMKLLSKKKSKSANKKKSSKRKKIKIQIEKNWREWSNHGQSSNKLSDFTIWLNSKLGTKEVPIKTLKDKSPAKSKKKTSDPLKSKIKNSVKINEAIVSESLAKLLGEQGHYEEAIQMYDKLCLIFPEKSSFFAAKIKDLKNI